MRNAICFFLAACSLAGAASLGAENPEIQPIKVNHFKIAASMFSDAQNWTDRQIVGEFRLQNRTGTELWRVLGSEEKIQIKGTGDVCQARLGQLLERKPPERFEGDIVVLVHGLCQTRAKMETIETHLKNTSKLRVINFGYASTQADIETHAAALGEVLQHAKPRAKVSFVGHSMGCIVVRSLLARNGKRDWKLGRVVMIAPPNQGAEMARRLSGSRLVRTCLGPGFEQLASDEPKGVASLRSPPCEFAVIAGTSPKWLLNSPLIAGDDDWIVGVNETRLAGAKAQACADSHHGDIVHEPKVLALTSQFLLHGDFDSRQEGK